MKILKAFTILSFVFFIFPFFQTCSDKRIIDDPMLRGNPLSHEISNTGEILYPKTDGDIKKLFYDFLETKERVTSTGYELIRSESWPLIGGLIINILIAISAFREKLKFVKILTIINFLIFLSFPIILYFSKILEDINQIKIGYYLCLFNFVFIYCQAQTAPNRR